MVNLPYANNAIKKVCRLLAIMLIIFAIGEIAVRIKYSPAEMGEFASDIEKCVNAYAENEHGYFGEKYVFDPLYGWSNKPNLKKQNALYYNAPDGKSYEVTQYDTMHNSEGIRAIKEFNREKDNSDNKVRVAFIGSSMIYGGDVQQFFSIPDVFDALTGNETEAINFASAGYAIDQQYIKFKNDIVNYNPDVFFMGIVVRDIAYSSTKCRERLKPILELRNEKLNIVNSDVLTPEQMKNYKKSRFQSYFLKILIYKIKHSRNLNEDYTNGFKILDKILDDIMEISKNRSIYFVVGIITDPEKIEEPINEGDYEETYKRKLIKMLENKKINYLNIDQILRDELDGFYSKQSIEMSSHFNPVGSGLISQYLKKLLESGNILPSSPDYYFFYNEWQPNVGTLLMINKQDKNDNQHIRSYRVSPNDIVIGRPIVMESDTVN